MYFGAKNEKRFKRLEQFYADLKVSLDFIKNQLPTSLDINQDKDQLIGIFESINDEVETARAQSKKNFYKNLYKNCILRSNQQIWNEEEYFVEILKNITNLEIMLLNFLSKKEQSAFTGNITAQGVPQELVDGSLSRLSDYGLLQKSIGSIVLSDNFGQQNMGYKITDLGFKFLIMIAT